MPKLTIDGQEIEVPAGMTVLQACEMAGKEIPRFCYHERLSIAGNCRMCLVEMEKSPKPIASCAMPAADNMVIHTDTPMVHKARRGVMEMLLINHPLDCPICDQGGECDLQDQAMGYGAGRSRFSENKRAVRDKNLGPLIKTVMTRCIHCTRCVRFATEVAGVEELGATGRGEDMEIGNYVEKALTSELSGNMIDLCPVGALTSKPFAFTARPWELRKTETVDVMDAVGANIRVDARGSEVMRVLPRLNEEINQEWITDKTRFAYDGLKRQRLDRPYVRRGGRLEEASWREAFDAIQARLSATPPDRIAAIAGDLVDAESAFALKSLMGRLNTPHLDCRQDGAHIDPAARAGYLFNTTIAGIMDADACLLVGTDPRAEAALINARLRERALRGGFKVANIGPALDLTFPVTHLGESADIVGQIATGSHPFTETLAQAARPMLILGEAALARADGPAILAACREIAERTGMILEDWNGFNLLHKAAGRVGALDLGFVPGEDGRDLAGILAGARAGEIDMVYLLGADEIDMGALGEAFVIYQGHHGDAGANRADVILPGAAYTEKDATYVNTEGRAQRAYLSVFPPGDAREDWKIVRALSEHVGHKLPFDSLAELRQHMIKAVPALGRLDRIAAAEWGHFGATGKIEPVAFRYPIGTFYMTCPISRASATMVACTAAVLDDQRKTGTDG